MRGVHIKSDQRRYDMLRAVYEKFGEHEFRCTQLERLAYVRGLDEFFCQTLREWHINGFVKRGAKMRIKGKDVNTWKLTALTMRLLG